MKPPVPIYILAGGKSRRFGSDKARARYRGRPMITQVASVVTEIAETLTVVADAPGKYDDLGLETIGDAFDQIGPLGGLAAAVNHCQSPWLLIVPCDFPDVQTEWVRTLLRFVADDYDAVAFRSVRWQPMPGLYRSTLSARIDACVKGGNTSMQSLLSCIRSRAVTLPNDWPEKAGFNSRSEMPAPE